MNTTLNSSPLVDFDIRISNASSELMLILKSVLADTNELFLKSNNLTEVLIGPAYSEVRADVDCCCTELSNTLPMFYEAMSKTNIEASQVACSINWFTSPKYAGWIDRVRELTSIHQKIRMTILDVFMNFNETDFLIVFKYLKVRLAIHEKYLWNLRTHIS